MIAFTYADNSEEVNKTLDAFQDALGDPAMAGPALREIADDFRVMIAQQFASEGRAEGTPWRPRRRGGSQTRPGQVIDLPLLVRTGALLESLIGPGTAGHVEELEDGAITLGTRLPDALFHQLGTRNMPARPIIVLSDERSAKWTEIVRGAIEEKAVLLGSKELRGGK